MFTELPLTAYIQKMAATPFPSPKGGSALAITGAMGAALLTMCCRVSANRHPEHRLYSRLEAQTEMLAATLITLADQDTATVYHMIQGFKLPRDTAANRQKTREAIAAATETLEAIEARGRELIAAAEALAPACAVSCRGDLDIAWAMARTVARGAEQMIRENYQAMARIAGENEQEKRE